jgi:hypothetical protein
MIASISIISCLCKSGSVLRPGRSQRREYAPESPILAFQVGQSETQISRKLAHYSMQFNNQQLQVEETFWGLFMLPVAA